MSATLLKDRILAQIIEQLNENGRQMMNLRFRPAQTAMATVNVATADGKTTTAQQPVGVLPATTAEHLGMQAAELNAERAALMLAASIVEEQHKILVAPEEKPDALVQSNGNGAAEPRIEPVY